MDQSEYIRTLADEVLRDIELSTLPADQLVLKASRLARMANSPNLLEFLNFELRGYTRTEVGEAYLAATDRWVDKEKGTAWYGGLGTIEGNIQSYEAKLRGLQIPSLSGDYVNIAILGIRQDMAATANLVAKFRSIRSKALAILHTYVTEIHYEAEFSTRQETIFESARLRVDALLAPVAKDALSQIDSIYQRLGSQDPEAVSQALTTCRRLIDAFADAVFAPQDQPREVEGVGPVTLGPQQHLNRVNAYVQDHTDSKGRRDRLRRRLADLYSRVSTGVHTEVSPDEARFLFLDTYLMLGEILSLATPEPNALPPVVDNALEGPTGSDVGTALPEA